MSRNQCECGDPSTRVGLMAVKSMKRHGVTRVSAAGRTGALGRLLQDRRDRGGVQPCPPGEASRVSPGTIQGWELGRVGQPPSTTSSGSPASSTSRSRRSSVRCSRTCPKAPFVISDHGSVCRGRRGDARTASASARGGLQALRLDDRRRRGEGAARGGDAGQAVAAGPRPDGSGRSMRDACFSSTSLSWIS